ncbi:hypothetical protein EDD22DRAFT_1049824, partial [Suillus occidentalis]
MPSRLAPYFLVQVNTRIFTWVTLHRDADSASGSVISIPIDNCFYASIFLNDIVTYWPLSRQFSLGVLTDQLGRTRYALPQNIYMKAALEEDLRQIFGLQSKTLSPRLISRRIAAFLPRYEGYEAIGNMDDSTHIGAHLSGVLPRDFGGIIGGG